MNNISSNRPRVSVIIPNYNHTRYIPHAVQSVLDQSYRLFEIIVVDDGSTDNSREVVAEFGSQVRYIRQENQGLGAARNTGIRAARGELVGLLDADDEWLPDYLEQMVSLADLHPEAAVYYCSAQAMDADGSDLPQVFGGPVSPAEMMYERLLQANFLIPSTILMRRSIVVAAGLFEQTLRDVHGCEDWDLWLRIAPEHAFMGTSERLVRYRMHGNTFSTNPAGMQKAVRAVIEKHFGSDDGQPAHWSVEKRKAYGGVYRYKLLTSIQRQNNWRAGSGYLRLALESDPELAGDLDLFYDLALGSQPAGYRGSQKQLDLEDNAVHIAELLNDVFNANFEPILMPLERQAFGTAYHALGLVAYNSGQFSLSRQFLLRALTYRPGLWQERSVSGNIVKSLFGRSLLGWVKKYKRKVDKDSNLVSV